MDMKSPDLSVDEKAPKKSQMSLDTITKKVSSVLSSCRICLSSIFNPAALTCGHRFCERCLNNYWRISKKPECIICPLCRNSAFNICFSTGAKMPSTEDFRKMFSPVVVSDLDIYRATIWFLKLMTIVPTLFYLFKWLKPILVQFYFDSITS